MELNIKTLTAGVISLMLALIITVAVFIPSMTSVAEDGTTYSNMSIQGGYSYVNEFEQADTVTAVWTVGSTTYTINGQEFDLTRATHIAVYSDCADIYVAQNGAVTAVYGNPATSSSGKLNIDLTWHNGRCTGTVGDVAVDLTYTKIYAEVPDSGEYRTCGGLGAFVTDDLSKFVICNNSTIDGTNVLYFAVGDTVIAPSSGVTVEWATTYDDDKGLYTLTALPTVNGVAKSFYLVPTAVTVGYLDSPEKALIELIPLLVLAGLVIAAVGMFIARRD